MKRKRKREKDKGELKIKSKKQKRKRQDKKEKKKKERVRQKYARKKIQIENLGKKREKKRGKENSMHPLIYIVHILYRIDEQLDRWCISRLKGRQMDIQMFSKPMHLYKLNITTIKESCNSPFKHQSLSPNFSLIYIIYIHSIFLSLILFLYIYVYTT